VRPPNTPARPRLQVVPDDDIDIEAERADDDRPPFAAVSSWPDPGDIEPRQRVYDHYMLGTLSATIADGGVGKTTLVIAEAVAMVTGRNLLGIEPTAPAKVLYWNGEESRDEIERRVLAICQHHGIDAKPELTGKLFIASGDEHPLVVASAGRDGILAGDLSALHDNLRDNEIDVLIIDPFVACHRVPENDNTAIDFVVKQLARLAATAHVAVDTVHHSRKPPFGGLVEIGANDARGASAFIDAVRSARVLNRMTEAEGQRAGVDNHRAYMRLDNGKSNYGPPSTSARWFKKVPVLLPSGDKFTPGDNVGVVVPWRFPGAFEGVTTAHLDKVRALAAAGDYRADAQSPDWIGRAAAEVIGLDADDDKARIKAVLKVWYANGALIKVERKDYKGMERTFVAPGAGTKP